MFVLKIIRNVQLGFPASNAKLIQFFILAECKNCSLQWKFKRHRIVDSPDHQVVNMGRKLQVNNLINLSFVWSIYSASAGQKICLVIDDGFLINRRGK